MKVLQLLDYQIELKWLGRVDVGLVIIRYFIQREKS